MSWGAVVALALAATPAAIDSEPANAAADTFDRRVEGVSCVPETTFCVAVGVSDEGDALPQGYAWISTADGFVSSPIARAGYRSALNAVDCVSATRCFAVGTYDSSTTGLTEQGLIQEWDGTSWKVASRLTKGVWSHLLSISCPGPTTCVAVGAYGAAGGVARTLALHWNGTTWKIIPSPSQGSVGTALRGVSCIDSTQCVAVGSYFLDGGNTRTFAATGNGQSWTKSLPPNPGVDEALHRDARLDDVSCSADGCVAVGAHDTTAAGSAPLVLRLVGGAWSVAVAPAAERHGVPRLRSISCRSMSACVAVGEREGTYIARWDGVGWSPTPAPSTESGEGLLADVSCRAASRCVTGGAGSTVVESTAFNPRIEPLLSAIPAGVASAPTVTAVTGGWLRLNVAWDAPMDTGASPVGSYRVIARSVQTIGTRTRWSYTADVPAGATRTSFTVERRDNVFEYEVRVIARNAAGFGERSASATVRVMNPGPLAVATRYSSEEHAAAQRAADHLGLTLTQLQHDAVLFLAFLTGFAQPTEITPTTPRPESSGPVSVVTDWENQDHAALFDTARQYALSPSETQKTAVAFVSFLVALGQ